MNWQPCTDQSLTAPGSTLTAPACWQQVCSHIRNTWNIPRKLYNIISHKWDKNFHTDNSCLPHWQPCMLKSLTAPGSILTAPACWQPLPSLLPHTEYHQTARNYNIIPHNLNKNSPHWQFLPLILTAPCMLTATAKSAPTYGISPNTKELYNIQLSMESPQTSL